MCHLSDEPDSKQAQSAQYEAYLIENSKTKINNHDLRTTLLHFSCGGERRRYGGA
jgi:hypothetical protein